MNSKMFTFPQEDDFISEGNESLTENIKNLRVNVIEELIKGKFEAKAKSTKKFIDGSLPNIFRLILNSEHTSRTLMSEIKLLIEKMFEFIIKAQLPINLLKIVNEKISDSNTLKNDHADGTSLDLFVIDENVDVKKLLSGNDVLREDRKVTTSIISYLLQTVVTSKIFNYSQKLFKSKNLSIEQIIILLELFTLIEPYVKKEFTCYYLPILVEYAIDVLERRNIEQEICKFFVTFITMIPSKLDVILSLLLNLVNKDFPVQNSYIIVSSIISIVNSAGLGESSEKIKRIMIEATSTSSHPSITNAIFSFLPKLSQKIMFNDDDLLNLLSTNKEQKFDCVIEIVSNIERPLDNFATKILSLNQFSPCLYCELIGHIENNEISHELFHRLLDSVQNYQSEISNIKINQKLNDLIEETISSTTKNNFELISSLSFFFLSLPDLESNIKTSKIFNLIFKKVCENFSKGITNEYSLSLFDMLLKWIDRSKRLSLETILNKIVEYGYFNYSSSLPLLISKIISKCNTKKYQDKIVEFLFEMLSDTVPPIFSGWFIELLFSFIHDDKKKIKRAVNIIFKNINNNSKSSNSHYLLYAAVLYEVDFYRIDDAFGLQKDLVIKYKKGEIHSKISFHPFHSTRRIYYKIAKLLNLEINSFSLSVSNYLEEDKLFQCGVPLQLICESLGSDEIILNVDIDTDETKTRDVIEPNFISYLETKIEFLFDLLSTENDFNEIIFQIILLLPYEQNNLTPQSDLQKILCGISINPFKYLNSIRIFPYALLVYDGNDLESIFDALFSHSYDTVSSSIVCNKLSKIKLEKFDFSRNLIRKGLIECKNRLFKESFMRFIYNSNNNVEHFLSLLDLTLVNQNRANTRQFYQCLSKFELNSNLFIPFYVKLVQFEESHYSDIDETFIGLIKLIPPTEDMIDLTIKRLFSPPKCDNLKVPFVHTIECWHSAFEFLKKNSLTISKLLPFLALVPCPTQSNNIELSDDFSYKGRNGIKNLGSTCYFNALLQIFPTFNNFYSKLISLPPDNLSPFVLEFRNIMSKLIYLRGKVLSIRKLLGTFSNFDTRIQQDAEEFFNMLVNRLHDELGKDEDITGNLKGEMNIEIYAKDKLISSRREDFYYLQVPTQNITRLDQSFQEYFKDEKIDDYMFNGEKTQAYRKTFVSKWPDYLVIQLQRWSYQLETGQRNKLVHEFDFPIHLKANNVNILDSDYSLTSVIVHQGDTLEHGHYLSIINDNDEWYLCNDRSIQYFDINTLRNWAFGGSISDDTSTGYLLFYKKDNLKINENKLAKDLEDYLNIENQKIWPSIIFHSNSFTKFSLEVIESFYDEKFTLEFAFNVFFKIAVLDNDMLYSWQEALISKLLKTHENCLIFFDFIEKNIGEKLFSIVSISDNVIEIFSVIFSHLFVILNDLSKPLMIFLKNIEVPDSLSSYKIKLLTMIYNIISSSFDNFVIDWTQENDLLAKILNFLFYPSKETITQIPKQHMLAFNSFLRVLNDILLAKGADDIIFYLFDMNKLMKVMCTIRKCEYFQKLLNNLSTISPDILQELSNSPNYNLISDLVPTSGVIDEGETLELDLTFVFNSVHKLLFSEDENMRKITLNTIIKVLPQPNESFLEYIDNLVFDEKTIRCKIPDDVNSFYIYLTGLIPHVLKKLKKGEEDECTEFIAVIYHISEISPQPFSNTFNYLIEYFSYINLQENIEKLLIILYRILSIYKDFITLLSKDNIKIILSKRYASRYTLYLLWTFNEYASKSEMLTCCLEYYLIHSDEKETDFLIKLIQKFNLTPKAIKLPKTINNFLSLKLLNCIWDFFKDKEKIVECMLQALSFAKPYFIFKQSNLFNESCSILNNFCPEKLNNLLTYLENY